MMKETRAKSGRVAGLVYLIKCPGFLFRSSKLAIDDDPCPAFVLLLYNSSLQSSSCNRKIPLSLSPDTF